MLKVIMCQGSKEEYMFFLKQYNKTLLQFDIEEDTGLYAFFLSMDDPDFTVDVAYSHNRYFSNTEDCLVTFVG